MNFLGIFKNVVKDVGVVAPYAAFGIGAINPALGAIVNRIGTAIVQVESQIPEDNQGPAKAMAVTQDFQSSMALTQSLLAQAGKTMTWDSGKLKEVIDAQAKALNLYAELAQSIKITDSATKPTVAGM